MSSWSRVEAEKTIVTHFGTWVTSDDFMQVKKNVTICS